MILINEERPDVDKVRKGVAFILQPMFKFPIENRIEVRADVFQFNKEDPGVWLQARGKRGHYYELYWDGEWICDFTEQMSKEQLFLAFNKGFLEKYQEDKVHLHTPEEWEKVKGKTAEDTINEAIKEQRKSKAIRKEDVLSQDVVVDMLEERKNKIKKTKKKLSKIYGE
jgi:hypothetical protein